MNALLILAAHNTVIALVLAVFVAGLTRVWRNPPVAHVLWLLVLLKLVTPPIVGVEWLTSRLPESTCTGDQITSDGLRIAGQKTEGLSSLVGQQFWNRGQSVLLWVWFGGAASCALVAMTRIVRFERLLQGTLPASIRLQRLALEVAAKLGVRRMPDVRHVECINVPLVWCVGRRPVIVLPMCLSRQLDNQQVAMILAHEFAHLRRRDHWVRVVELMVSAIYWWNPLVWVIRRQIHRAEEHCCDAWVCQAFPDCTKRYAEVVLTAAESFSAFKVGAALAAVTPFLRSSSLKDRIEFLLGRQFAPRVSGKSRAVIALLALLVLPSFVQIPSVCGWKTRRAGRGFVLTEMAMWAASNDEAPMTADSRTTLDFPCAVKFEQGTTHFLNGDEITIIAVRGTADTFTPGNTYWIEGTYTLASHDWATLRVGTTAQDASNAQSATSTVQTTVVTRGSGSFTLSLPMLYRGWPHVNFYPAEGGEGFGRNYFGTGDSVLKRVTGALTDIWEATDVPRR